MIQLLQRYLRYKIVNLARGLADRHLEHFEPRIIKARLQFSSNNSIVIYTHKHSGDVVGELLGDDRERGGEEGGVAHRLHDADHEAQRDERHMTFHFVQHPEDTSAISILEAIAHW